MTIVGCCLVCLCVVFYQNIKLGYQSFRLCEGTLGKTVVIASKRIACCCKHGGCLKVEHGIACGESPHIVGHAAALAIG